MKIIQSKIMRHDEYKDVELFRSLSLSFEADFRSSKGSVTPLDLQDHCLDQFMKSSSRYMNMSNSAGLVHFKVQYCSLICPGWSVI